MQILLDSLVYLALAAALSWLFFYLRRFDLLGGFLGGVLVALIGSILGAFLFSMPLKYAIDKLQNGFGVFNVNIIAAIIGGLSSLWLLTKINNERKRKDY
ncbi:MAG: hypothetical protein LDLANPLL_02776 [Turneriella sp.]|nr:hypothetical protein [Turneriella sp.]